MNKYDIAKEIADGLDTEIGMNYRWLIEGSNIIGRWYSFISGFLAAVILVVLPIVIIVEVMYINIPTFRDKLEDIIDKTTGRSKTFVGIAVRDAKIAVYKANTVETGRSANWVYLFIKLKFIIITVVILAIVVGFVPGLVSFIWNIVVRIIAGIGKSL